MREEFNPLIKTCITRPDSYRDVPAAKTKSIGMQHLRINASVCEAHLPSVAKGLPKVTPAAMANKASRRTSCHGFCITTKTVLS
jgi:hypothetical protein